MIFGEDNFFVVADEENFFQRVEVGGRREERAGLAAYRRRDLYHGIFQPDVNLIKALVKVLDRLRIKPRRLGKIIQI